MSNFSLSLSRAAAFGPRSPPPSLAHWVGGRWAPGHVVGAFPITGGPPPPRKGWWSYTRSHICHGGNWKDMPPRAAFSDRAAVVKRLLLELRHAAGERPAAAAHQRAQQQERAAPAAAADDGKSCGAQRKRACSLPPAAGGQQPQLPCSGEHVPREKRASFTNSGDPGVFIGYDDSDPQTYLIGAQEPRRRSG